MLTLDELREQYPSFKQFSDDELLSRVSSALGSPLEDVAQDFGIKDPAKKPRGFMGAANDTVVNFSNAALGGVKAGIDFVSPGSRASSAIEGLIESGNQTKTLSTRIADEKLSQALDTSDIGTQLSGVGKYVMENPLQAVSQAAGSFALPGGAIKGARAGAKALGLVDDAVDAARSVGPITAEAAALAGNQVLSRAGTGAAMLTGGMLAGGDAAGDAYDMVLKGGGSEEDATRAARAASVAPALIGAIGGRFGAEGALAKGGTRSILKTGGAEFATEAFEEGSTKLSANVAAGQYVDGIDPMTGVVGSAAMGGILGGGTGLAVGAMTKQSPMLKGANTSQESDGSGGISGALGNDPLAGTNMPLAPPPSAPPGVNSGAVAQANAQANQQQQQVDQQQQAAQQQQAFAEGSKLFGIAPLAGRQDQFSFGGKPLFSTQQATQFMQGIEQAATAAGLGQEQLPLIGAVVGANAVKFTAKTTPQQAVNSVKKFMETYGLQDAPNQQEIADRLNTQIEMSEGNSGLKIASQLNDVFFKLAGANAPAFDTLTAQIDGVEQTKAAQTAAKKPASVPAAQAPSAVTSVPVDQYNAQQGTNDGSQLQAASGVGAVSDQGSTGQSGAGEVSNLIQSDGLELVGAGSESAGSPGQQDVVVRKKRTRYVAPAKPDAVSGSSDTKPKAPEVTKPADPPKGGEFPMLNDSLPYVVPKGFVQQYADSLMDFHKQSVDRLAQRGGLTHKELLAAIRPELRDRIYGLPDAQSVEMLGTLINEFNGKTKSETTSKPVAKTDAAVRTNSSVDEDTLDDGDAPISRMEQTEDGLSLEDLGINEDGENDLGFRTFDPDSQGEAQAGDVAGTNRSLSVFRKAVTAKKLSGVEDYVLNNVFVDEKSTAAERDAVVKELERRAAVVTAKAKKGKSKAAQKKQEDDSSETGEDEYLTDREAAEKSWDKHASKIPGAPLFAELKEDFQDTFTEYGSDNWKRADVVRLMEKAEPEMSKSEGKGGSNAQDIRDEITAFIGTENRQKLVVVQSVADIPSLVQRIIQASKEKLNGKTQAVVVGGRAYLIADNIAPGKARAVFLHEVGSHLGLQGNEFSPGLLSDEQFDRLVDQIVAWGGKDDGSLEHDLAVRAMQRVKAAKTKLSSYNNELLAYFIEEAVNAGVDPTATKFKTGVERWLKTVYAAFKNALNKLGFKNMNLTAQDIVDMSYGAAQLVMSGALDTQQQTTTSTRTPATAEFSRSATADQIDSLRGRAKSTIDKLPPSMRGPVRAIHNTLFGGKETLLGVMITEDVADKAKRVMPSVTNFVDAQHERTKIAQDIEAKLTTTLVDFEKLDENTRKAVNNVIAESTVNGKWAYDPKLEGVTFKTEDGQLFRALPKEAQKVVRDVFTFGRESLIQKKQAIRDQIDAAFSEKLLEAANDPAALKRVEEQKAQMNKSFASVLNINPNTPYAPLKRFGSFVVVAKSEQYKDAERNKDTKEIARLRGDENHYIVEFGETMGEAEEIYDKLDQRGTFATVDRPFKKSLARDQLYSGTDLYKGFAKLKRVISNEKGVDNGSEVLNKLESLVNELYLLSLAESSARKAELQRKKISGFNRDMMRAFFSQGMADAHYIANLKTNEKILDSIVAMQREAGQNRSEAYPYLNELMAREAQALEVRPPSIGDSLNRMTADYFLTFSPSFYLQQLTQTFMLSLPWLAGRYNYGRSASALMGAYKEVLPMVKGTGLRERMDFSDAPADVRDMLQTLIGRGRINIGIEADLGSMRTEAANPVSGTYVKVANKMRGAINRIEAINRATAAIAAYRLEMQASGNKTKATEAADRVVRTTHGLYDGFNTPRLFRQNAVTRSITQFKRFQVIQLTMLAGLMKDSMKGASATERAMARKQLGFLFAHTFVLGGVKGLPIYGMLSLAYGILNAAFGEEDDPEDFEAWLRSQGGLLLARGIPASLGVDTSGKLGLGNTMSLMPYQEFDLTSRDGVAKTALALLGPFAGGLMPQMADGVGSVMQGDYYKGLEKFIPNGLSNGMKAARFTNDGVTLRNGDVVINPEDISYADAALQALGLPPTTLTERTYRQGQVIETEKFFADRSLSVKNEYVKAYRDGDSSAMSEARDSWNNLQDARVKNGFQRQPSSLLFKAPQDQIKRERNSAGGVEFNKGNKGFVQRLAGEQ